MEEINAKSKCDRQFQVSYFHLKHHSDSYTKSLNKVFLQCGNQKSIELVKHANTFIYSFQVDEKDIICSDLLLKLSFSSGGNFFINIGKNHYELYQIYNYSNISKDVGNIQHLNHISLYMRNNFYVDYFIVDGSETSTKEFDSTTSYDDFKMLSILLGLLYRVKKFNVEMTFEAFKCKFYLS
jgi:hypothetical protein